MSFQAPRLYSKISWLAWLSADTYERENIKTEILSKVPDGYTLVSEEPKYYKRGEFEPFSTELAVWEAKLE